MYTNKQGVLSCWFKHVLTVWQVLKCFQLRFTFSTKDLGLPLTLLTITICYIKIYWSKDVPPCLFLLLLLLLSFSVFLFWSECTLMYVSPLPSELLDWPLRLMPLLVTNNYVGNPRLGLLNIFMQMWSWHWRLSSTLLATGAKDSKGVHPFACPMYLHRHLAKGEGRFGQVCFGLLGPHHVVQTAERPACKPKPKMQSPITDKAHKQRKMCQTQWPSKSHLVVIALQLWNSLLLSAESAPECEFSHELKRV